MNTFNEELERIRRKKLENLRKGGG